MASFDEFVASLEADYGPQGKGVKFEVFCKWFLENDPQWSKVVDQVWSYKDYPDKWQSTDLGTDLVFRDKDGQIWAVQAKCYDQSRRTKKADMDSFLADSGRGQVSRRLWLQTTNKIETKAKQTCVDQEKPVIFYNLDDFRAAAIDYPASFKDMFESKIKPKPIPDLHQRKAIKDVVAGFEGTSKGQLIMACGTGKTFTTLWIKEELKSNSTLVLLPSLSLLSQTLHEWAWASRSEFEVLAVCSDQSVGRNPEDMKVMDAPFKVSSDVTEIKSFLKKQNSKVVFCTYQSSELISEAMSDKTIAAFDLTIADEAHRCAGKATSEFANVLDDCKLRSSRKLFTTATPRFISQTVKTKAKDRELEVFDMNDASKFGAVLHKLSFGEAINYQPEPLLNDYRVVIVGVDEPTVRRWIEQYEIIDLGDGNETDARTLAAKIALIKTINDYNLSRIISFHSKVKSAKVFADTFLDTVDQIDEHERPTGVIHVDHVSGKMSTFDRKEKINRLKALEGIDIGLLTNARCLSEGVDVPTLDGVAFIDPKSSQVDIVQSVGRAIRKVRGAKVQNKGTIILPVFIEDADDAENVIQKSNFKPVWDVLKALRAHDDELSERLDNYRLNLSKNTPRNRENISDKIIFDLPVTVSPEFADSLSTYLVESVTDSWEYYFKSLQNYISEHGDSLVSLSYIDHGGYKLGEWVNTQRYIKDEMSIERKRRLEALSHWVWSAIEEKWEIGYKHLANYYDTFQSAKVKYEYLTPEDYPLGKWVHKQRLARDKVPSANSPLTREDIIKRNSRLEEFPDWSWGVNADRWEDGYRALVTFVKEHDSTFVPKSFITADNFPLGTWIRQQRQQYARMEKEGREFPLSRREKLEALPGWAWDGRNWEIHPNSKLHEVDGELLTINQISEKYHLPKSTINNRVHWGWSWEKIVTTPLAEAESYEVDNVTYTAPQLCELLKISSTSLRRYLKAEFSAQKLSEISSNIKNNGFIVCDKCSKQIKSLRQIMSHFHKCEPGEHFNAEKYLFEGKLLTLKQIEDVSGIDVSTLRSRIKHQNKTAVQAVEMGPSRNAPLEFEGKIYRKGEFLKKFKIDSKTYYSNYKKMSLAEIVDKFGTRPDQ